MTPIAYTPQGAIASMKLGKLLIETDAYNNRLQPTSVSLGRRRGASAGKI